MHAPTKGYRCWKTSGLALCVAILAALMVCATRGHRTTHRTNHVQPAHTLTWPRVPVTYERERAHAQGAARPVWTGAPFQGAARSFQPSLRASRKDRVHQSSHVRTPPRMDRFSVLGTVLWCGALALAMVGVGVRWLGAPGAQTVMRCAALQSRPDAWRVVPVSGKALDEGVYMTTEQMRALVAGTQLFLFDIDGVFWRGDQLIEGVWDTLRMLKALGKTVVFVTNNSTKSRAAIADKFRRMGYAEADAAEIYSSAYAAASYLQSIGFPRHKKAYVIGDAGIGQELRAVGIDHFGGADDGGKAVELRPGAEVRHDPDVGAVVVGLDLQINYYKIQYAQLCINRNPGCLFIATNRDATGHITSAQEWAAGGSCVGAVEGCTRAPILVGKPSGYVMEDIVRRFGVARQEVCMVGDRLDSDIAFGRNNGTKTLLVMSGVTDADMLMRSADLQPDFVAHTLADLLAVLSDHR